MEDYDEAQYRVQNESKWNTHRLQYSNTVNTVILMMDMISEPFHSLDNLHGNHSHNETDDHKIKGEEKDHHLMTKRGKCFNFVSKNL